MGVTVEVDTMYTADKRLYLNEDRSQVVEEGDPNARFLLASEGTMLTDEDAKKFGLTGKKAAVPEPEPVQSTAADQPENKAAEDAPETKAVEAAPENKAQTMRSRKAD